MDSRNANYELVGVSQNIRRIRELIGRVAETGFNVIVCGETGVGKELVVSNLYQRSNRLGQPFIKVNCAALPDALLESEMFGYERGAFTGAIRTRRGKFEQANGGVLFLDEIGDMSLPLQSKLLHVLQGGDFTPLGSEKPIQTDVWVITATNRDLEQDVERGRFRNDLYYRLSTIRISVAPLRTRPEDVPLLIDYYIKKYAQQFNETHASVLSPEALAKMVAYPWPGNVRELQNVLQRIIVLGEGEETLDGMLMAAAISPAAAHGPARGGGSSSLMRMLAADGGAVDLSDLALKKIRKKATNQVERELISFVLIKTGWNRSKASRILNVSYKTLLQKIEELAIVPPPELA
ncbi:MAG: sigma-54-dependent Fis family transcriptional regulator [Deltaproteobacteria bacterium]|nr:sigma-54-dependent Fis family transcriptional regulator [Deltaproteobacteria bacterium]